MVESGFRDALSELRALALVAGCEARRQFGPCWASAGRFFVRAKAGVGPGAQAGRARWMEVHVTSISRVAKDRAEIQRLRRLYDALRLVNRAIVQLRTREELLQEICRIAVESGGFALAWFGWIDRESHRIVPVTHYGNHSGFLQHAVMSADERPEGRGPAGLSVRSGKPYICNDYVNDPTTLLWREEAAKHGFKASCTVPIRLNGAIVGILGLYALEAGYFQSKEVALLEEVAGDVSFALDNFAREKKRMRAEEAARLLAAIVESTSDAIYSHSIEGQILSWNQSAERMYGYAAEEICGQNFSILIAPDRIEDGTALLRRIRSGERVIGYETVHQRKDGRQFPVSLTISPYRSVTGEVIGASKIARDITEKKQVETALTESKELLQLFIEHAPAALAMFDREMRYLAASRRWLENNALGGQDIVGRSHYETHPTIPEKWKEAHRLGLAGKAVRSEEDLFVGADGVERWRKWEVLPWLTGEGVVGGIIIFSEDITRQKHVEERLHLAASVFAHAAEGITITDADGTILDVNEAFTRITGYNREEVLGKNPRILNSGRQGRDFYAEMWNHLIAKGHWSGEIWNRAKDGHIFAEMLTISAVRDAGGKTQQYVAMFSDITSIKEHERQLERIAHYDVLTGLPNRVLLADRLHQAMAQAHRTGRPIAIACLDLDNFKPVNERHGHNTGDNLLTAVTTRVRQVLREGDTLARLGGDEFVAVLLDVGSAEESIPVLNALLDAVAQPVRVDELTLQVSASIGVTFYPQAEDVDPDQLLRQADQAMYQAKLEGKNRYHLFDPHEDRSVRGHHEDIERIRHALKEGEFVLYYQPKVNMCTGEILGAEGLIRWRHPEAGLLPPVQFLPVVEGHPIAIELGEWVIDSALKQMDQWRAEGFKIQISVNVAAQQLLDAGFVKSLRGLLAAHPDVPASSLELEVLESSALEDVAQVSRVIRSCNELGVSFALDDFGTGYSSLSYLKRLPVDVLKIDQSFVHDMLDDPEDLTILEGVLGLATAFRRQAVAEGVETVEHGQMLLRLGCPVAQGYGIARPMPAEDLPGWVASWRPYPQWANVAAVEPVDWPLLYASVEHRAWFIAIEDYLNGHRHTAPVLEHQQCRFGGWLFAEAAAGRGGRPGFKDLEALHQQVHSLASEILALKASGHGAAALVALEELHAMRDTLLEKLNNLVRSL